jgi:inhibitor of cysteine peptidase
MDAGASEGAAMLQADGPGTYQLQVGQQLVVRLPETPTTGYLWQVVGDHDGLVVEVGAYQPGSDAPGAQGIRLITATATEPGTHKLATTTLAPLVVPHQR